MMDARKTRPATSKNLALFMQTYKHSSHSSVEGCSENLHNVDKKHRVIFEKIHTRAKRQPL